VFAKEFDLEPGDNFTVNIAIIQGQYDEFLDIYEEYRFVVNISNIPILGIMNIPVPRDFGEFIGEPWGYYPEDTRFFLGNITYVGNLITQFSTLLEEVAISNEYEDTVFSIRYGMLLDHDVLVDVQPSGMAQRLEYIEQRIERVGNGDFYGIYTSLGTTLQMVQLEILLYQSLFLIVSLPVLILGWYMCKTNWLLSYQRRRREIALLKVKGGISKQLRTMFFLEATIIGAIGGLFGIIGGNFTSTLVLSRIYPQALEGETFLEIMGQMFSGEFLQLSTWILGLIGGILMSWFAVRKPLKEYAKMEPIEGLAKYHEATHKKIPKKKMDVFLLFLGGIPILISIGSNLLMDSLGFSAYIIIAPLMGISTALIPFAPFILTYALVKLLCRNIVLFQKVIAKISKLFSKSISVFTTKSIVNNQARSFRLVFIVAMSLSFLVLASTVEGSELEFQAQRHTVLTGDGLRIDFSSPKLATSGTEVLMNEIFANKSTLHVESINWLGNLYGSYLKGEGQSGGDMFIDDYYYYGSTQINLISAENYTEFMDIREKWIESEFGIDAIAKLAEGNYCLIPVSMVEQGYLIGENITFLYPSSNTSMLDDAEIELEILGSYDAFPLTDEYSWSQQIIVANSTITDGMMYEISIAMYPTANYTIEDLEIDTIIDFLEDWDNSGGYAYNYYNWMEGATDITGSLLRFLNLESIYLLTIVTFGIAIIMYISINEKSHEMGLLRARGVDKSVLYKIQIAEGTTLILLGAAFTFTGIVGGASIIYQLNNLNFMGGMAGGMERSLVIPWGKMFLQLIGSLAAFLVSIIVAVAIETKKSDVTKIGDLLRIAS
ncbi:MAG: FtsX-like permease family protein, partial [Promethearchaeota archaeon]